ncbi:hypothetical protein AGMMS49938_10590 [Fibrobacterales bacterium]|nr:hypothetical protein AGMMS49938_10590 [Fibrobacterales bacterium]
MTNIEIKKNSIVFFNIAYLLIIDSLFIRIMSILKTKCETANSRLIIYYYPCSLLGKKNLSATEKWYLNNTAKNSLESLKKYELDSIPIIDSLIKSGYEIYIPPKKFFETKETIHLDSTGAHFADRGKKIITEHLANIVLGKEKSNINKMEISVKTKISQGKKICEILVPIVFNYIEGITPPITLGNGSIVMNCNPFTFGHLHLIKYAAARCKHLYIFVVEEDKSFFPFKDRFNLVKECTKNIKNVSVIPSGNFIISAQTFGAYFAKENDETKKQKPDVSLDLLIFGSVIAPNLNIANRFVGEEPFDPVTKHYNEEMKRFLPEYGVKIVEIPRLEIADLIISASRVRTLLKEKNWSEIKRIVPKATLEYLKTFTPPSGFPHSRE